MISDDIDTLARMAVSGGGIARLAAFVARPYLDNGDLIALFEQGPQVEVEAEPLEFYFCVTDRYARTPKVAALYDYLTAHLPAIWRQ
jgi:DNA-binding transcriptional LysR family regulator